MLGEILFSEALAVLPRALGATLEVLQAMEGS